MKVLFKQSFVKDLAVLDANHAARVRSIIEALETAATLREVPHIMKLHSEFFRIRIGNYRLGLALSADEVTLVRCLPRKEIYRHFP